MVAVVVLTISLKDKRKWFQQIQNVLLKCLVGLETRNSNKIIVTGTSIKKVPKIILLVDHILQNIQDLDNHPNVTNRVFPPLILYAYLYIMYGIYSNTEDDMIPFFDYDSKVLLLPLPEGFTRYPTPTLIHVAFLDSPGKCFLLEINKIINNHISLTPPIKCAYTHGENKNNIIGLV